MNRELTSVLIAAASLSSILAGPSALIAAEPPAKTSSAAPTKDTTAAPDPEKKGQSASWGERIVGFRDTMALADLKEFVHAHSAGKES